MRTIILAAALVTLAPIAFAQSSAGSKATTSHQNRPATSSASNTTGQGENCGTPDQFKPCPPLPRHPLQNYPGYKE